MLQAILFLILWIGIWLALVMSSFFTTSSGIFASGALAFIAAAAITAIVSWLFSGLIWIIIIIGGIILVCLVVKKIKGGGKSDDDLSDSDSSENEEED